MSSNDGSLLSSSISISMVSEKTGISRKLLERFSDEEIEKYASSVRWWARAQVDPSVVAAFSAMAVGVGSVGLRGSLAYLLPLFAGGLGGVWSIAALGSREALVTSVTDRAAELAGSPSVQRPEGPK